MRFADYLAWVDRDIISFVSVCAIRLAVSIRNGSRKFLLLRMVWQLLTQSISGRRAIGESGAWIKKLQESVAGGTLAAEGFPWARGFRIECPYNPSPRFEPLARLNA